MPAWTRTLLLGSLIVTALSASRAAAQAPGDLPAAPVPINPAPAPAPPALGRPVPLVVPPSPGSRPGLAEPPPPTPPPAVLAPPTPLTYAPPPRPPDPGPAGWGPYGPPSPQDSLFVIGELTILKPALKNRITNDTPLANGNRLRVPSVPLDTTVSPLLELGYRLPDCAGQFSVGYRFFSAEGNGQGVLDGMPAPIRTRADLHFIDFDYGTAPLEVAPRWDLSWRLGARLADVFFDSRLGSDGNLMQASNTLFGGGAHGRVDIERRIVPAPGLALFGRLDGAVVVGQIKQRFRQDVTGPDGVLVSASNFMRKTQAVPILNLQAGLSYAPPFCNNLKFTTG